MSNINCRGEKRRIQIVNNYVVKPIAYLRLLNGQKKRSDAEADLTDKYYIFECVLKSNTNITEKIICGNGAGSHFLQLTNQESPSIFDPLKSSGIENQGNSVRGEGVQAEQWNETAKQLYNAIHWLTICWDIIPRKWMIDIRDKIDKSRHEEPLLRDIKSINTTISKDSRKRTLTEMINVLRENNDIKKYDFNLLNSKMEKEGIKSYF